MQRSLVEIVSKNTSLILPSIMLIFFEYNNARLAVIDVAEEELKFKLS